MLRLLPLLAFAWDELALQLLGLRVKLGSHFREFRSDSAFAGEIGQLSAVSGFLAQLSYAFGHWSKYIL